MATLTKTEKLCSDFHYGLLIQIVFKEGHVQIRWNIISFKNWYV